MTKTTLPDSIGRLSQDHIDMRMALNMLEREVDAVAQYHDPDGDLLGGAAQYFATFPQQCHHPIEELIHDVLSSRAPDAATQAMAVKDHDSIEERVGEFALMTRNLFIDAPKWRVPFCSTARGFITAKRDHIRDEERLLFRLALEHLQPEDWLAIDRATRTANAKWNDDPSGGAAYDVLKLTGERAARANGAARPR